MRLKPIDLIALLVALVIACTAHYAFAQVTFGGVGTSSSPVISSGPPPNGQVGVGYVWTATAMGGTQPYTWAIIAGNLPLGLSLNASTGLVSGTPTSAGAFTFSLQVTDTNGKQSSPVFFTITITSQVTITNGVPPNGVAGSPYSFLFTAAGGTPPYSWTVASGSLAGCGLSLSAAGSLTGTPSVAGSCTFTVKATDAVGGTATSPSYTITITSSSPTCGPPTYPCSRRDTLIVPYNAVPPFAGATGANTVAYDTSLNASGTDPILRLTDSSINGGGCTVTPSGGDNDNIINSNDTLIIVTCGSGGARFPVGFTLSPLQTTGVGSSLSHAGGGITFKHGNSLVMYSSQQSASGGVNGGAIYQTTFTSTNPPAFTQTLLYDPIASCALLSGKSGIGGNLSISLDDDVLYELIFTTGQNSPGFMVAYKISTGQCSAVDTTTGMVQLYNGTQMASTAPCVPFAVHGGYIYRSGQYVNASSAAGTCPQFNHNWQINSTNVFVCNPQLSGHNSNGYTLSLQASNPVLHYGDISSPTFCTDLSSQSYGTFIWSGQAGDVENHFSTNNINSGDSSPIGTTTGYTNWDGSTAWTAPGVNEVMIWLRSPFTTIRIAHTYNSGMTLCPSCDFRDVQGISAISQTGKAIAFNSDMRLTLGTSGTTQRTDVFLVVPQ